jgi:hypothetical protein
MMKNTKPAAKERTLMIAIASRNSGNRVGAGVRTRLITKARNRGGAPWTPRTYLLHGMIWLFVGIASLVALSAVAVTSRRPISWEARLAAVNDARFRGATPEELQILLNSLREEDGIPIGLGFLGFIPIGVGLAYLIFYKVESKKLLF